MAESMVHKRAGKTRATLRRLPGRGNRDTCPAMVSPTPSDARPIANWLFAICGLIFLIVVVGGATRLTESGLSITHWSPVSGVVPPLSEAQWQAELALYRQTPEYQQVNKGMTLDQFKQIYWWEYIHRLLGRVIGLAFAVPFLWFLVRKRIPEGVTPKLAGLFVLGGLQGALGWWMVKSGLVDRPDVSHYRLTAHLGLALFVFALTFWLALTLRNRLDRSGDATLAQLGWVVLGLLVLQIGLGGFVAGLNAGFAFNTWPLMGETFVPEGMATLSPWWLNLLENPITVQFAHRMTAYVLFFVGLGWAWRAWRSPDAGSRPLAAMVLAALLLQMLLGIFTVIYGVPIWLGTAHQGGAVILLAVILLLQHRSVRAAP
jgi:heme a synthase